jgi:hypothetical protein
MAFIVLICSVRVYHNCLRLREYVCVFHSHSKTVKSIFSGEFLRATQLLQEIDLECPKSIALAPRPSSLRSYSSDASWQDTLGVNWHASAASDSSRSSILLASSGNRLDSAERNNCSELLHGTVQTGDARAEDSAVAQRLLMNYPIWTSSKLSSDTNVFWVHQ